MRGRPRFHLPLARPRMIPYATYKVIHYLGIFVLLTALATRLGRAATHGSAPDGTDPDGPGPEPWARRLGMLHGLALFLVLLGGFGMLARLDVTTGLSLPGWIWAKLAIWTALGAAILAASRSVAWSARLLVAVPALAVLAGFVALTKPF